LPGDGTEVFGTTDPGKGSNNDGCGYKDNAKEIFERGRIGFGGTHRAGGGALFGIRL
jgi:hypothetical protein